MYPAFQAVAKLQEERSALLSIHYALEAEKIHEVLYGDAKNTVAIGNDIKTGPVYVCPVCGHTALGEAPDKCPVCSAKKEQYREF
jgi:rubrerythrin